MYDKENDCYACPAGAILTRQSKRPNAKGQLVYRARKTICHACDRREACFGGKVGQKGKSISRSKDQEYVDWGDGWLSKAKRKQLMKRRKCVIEGSFGDAATHHGFKRARWRNRWKMKIQNLMIAAIQNLRKLVKYGNRMRRKAEAGVLEVTLLIYGTPIRL